MALIHDPALYQLRHALRGHVYDPGEPEYEHARTLSNAMVEGERTVAHERLARVKAGWDPQNVFRSTGHPRATD